MQGSVTILNPLGSEVVCTALPLGVGLLPGATIFDNSFCHNFDRFLTILYSGGLM